jgi:prephenate dehydrogenase
VRGFVPSHPIAGSERSGPHAARADLFEGRAWSFEPAVPDEARERATRFIEAMGALPVAIASLEHDRVVALTSHLPQLVSVALGAALEPALREARTSALCGTGVRSMLRLAGSSWTVWRAVLEANAIPIAQEVRRLAAILTGVAEALEDGDAALLERRFGEAAGAAASLRAPHDER